MRYLKSFNESNGTNNFESLIGSRSISVDIENKVFILRTNRGNLNACCSGGNCIDFSFSVSNTDNVNGLIVKDIKMINDYEFYILFDNGLSINVFDDSGGEGIEIYLD